MYDAIGHIAKLKETQNKFLKKLDLFRWQRGATTFSQHDTWIWISSTFVSYMIHKSNDQNMSSFTNIYSKVSI